MASTSSSICARCLLRATFRRSSTAPLVASCNNRTISATRPLSSHAPSLSSSTPPPALSRIHKEHRNNIRTLRSFSSGSALSRPEPTSAPTEAPAPPPPSAPPAAQQNATRPISGPGAESGASIAITPRAVQRLAAIAQKDDNPNLALRVSVESGGCHGFQYLMSLTTLGEKEKVSNPDKDAEAEDDLPDTIFEGPQGVKVVMDEPSLELLNGSTVDYTMELIGSQFKVTGIPGASSSCGCGTSFDIK